MNTRNILGIICGFILACAVFLPAAQAGERDQLTKLKFSEPVEIPSHILPAGSYWFVLQDNQSDRNIVQIFTADWKKLEANFDNRAHRALGRNQRDSDRVRRASA
jgi:hypothetical protein